MRIRRLDVCERCSASRGGWRAAERRFLKKDTVQGLEVGDPQACITWIVLGYSQIHQMFPHSMVWKMNVLSQESARCAEHSLGCLQMLSQIYCVQTSPLLQAKPPCLAHSGAWVVAGVKRAAAVAV
jgi:hypothetical protein